MADPIVSSEDLGTYLDKTFADDTRPRMMIRLAQDKVEAFISPIVVDGQASGVVLEVAARALTNVTSAHSISVGTGSVAYGSQNSSTGIGGMHLSVANQKELSRIYGLRGGAFSIELLPDTAGQNLPAWDLGGSDLNGWS